MTEVDKKWFFQKLDERQKSVRGLARHLSIDPSAASRMLSGARRMKMEEANEIALFLGVSLSDVLNHAGVSIERDGTPTRILLAAIINEAGSVERLKEPRPLPQAVIDRAKAAVRDLVEGQVIAAQVRAASGPLSIWDDAVILFSHTDEVETAAIGVLSICRTRGGEQIMAKVERARKTGEARIQTASGAVEETLLDTATPVLAVIP